MSSASVFSNRLSITRQESVTTRLRKMIAALAGRSGAPGLLGDFPHPFRILFDPYRPELHYMRGPGPKWHAKHDRPTQKATAVGASRASSISARRLAQR